MPFQRFELVTHQRGSSFGTIDKLGRLLIPRAIVDAAALTAGQHVELYFDPQDKQLGFKKVDAETMYSVQIKVNSKAREDGTKETYRIGVQSLLTVYGIFVPKRIRGRMGVMPDGMIVFKFEDMVSTPMPTNSGIVGQPTPLVLEATA